MPKSPSSESADHSKYTQALLLAARPIGTEASTERHSHLFEDICVQFGFPHPRKQKTGEAVLDKNLPNVFIRTVNEDYLALAQSLSQTGKCNTVIVFANDYAINPVTNNFEAIQGAVYRNNEIILARFLKPVPCHYFLSDFTVDKRMDPIEHGVVASNCIPSIRDIIQDKIAMKKILFEHDISTAPYLDCEGFFELSDKEIAQRLHAFCVAQNCTEFVVKPTNTDGGNGVCFFPLENARTAAHYIRALLMSDLKVIVEKRIFSLPFKLKNVTQDWNLRVFVTRGASNHFITDGMLVRTDDIGKPVNLSISAHAMLFDDVLTKAGVPLKAQKTLYKAIEKVCVRATMHVINDLLKTHPAQHYLQQDWMGIDIIVSKEAGNYIPYIIELNNEDSGGTWEHDKLLNPGRNKSKSSCPAYVETIIRRAMLQKMSSASYAQPGY